MGDRPSKTIRLYHLFPLESRPSTLVASHPLRWRIDAGEPVSAVGFAPHAPLLAAATRRSVRVRDTGEWEPVVTLTAQLPHELAIGPGPGGGKRGSGRHDRELI